MDSWRNLPKYALERRVDIFFGVYLKTVLEAKYRIKLKDVIIPEFPIHKGILNPNIKGNPSFNVDFLAFSEDTKIAFLVELKTDISSRREIQDQYLKAAANKGFNRIIEGLFEIFRATKIKKKYFHLFRLLEFAGVIKLPDELQTKVFSNNMSGVMTMLRKSKILAQVEQIEILYVQPNGKGENIINFNEFSSLIERYSDPITLRFIESLNKWSTIEAGNIDTY